MTPAIHVRVVLQYHRGIGTEFESAWLSALRSLPKGTQEMAKLQLKEWKRALQWAKPAFRDAYHGIDPPGGIAVLALLEPDAPRDEVLAA